LRISIEPGVERKLEPNTGVVSCTLDRHGQAWLHRVVPFILRARLELLDKNWEFGVEASRKRVRFKTFDLDDHDEAMMYDRALCRNH
jgi:hypothetical protein